MSGVEHTLGLATSYYFLSERCFLKVAVLSLLGAVSDERSGLSLYPREVEVEVKVTLKPMVGQSVSMLCVKPTLGFVTRYYLLSESCFLKVSVLSLCGVLSDRRSGLSFVSLSL
jgi:hypothetical protein